jgi:serine/threonine protein kinase
MPAPSSPNSADRSSVRRIGVPTDEVVALPVTEADTSDHIEIQSVTDQSPTVITSNRPRTFDSKLGESLSGRRLGQFELIEAVGAGGMAAVLKARDVDLGRIVALKILPPDMAADPENITRFKQEARAAAKLDHENVARVYHCGDDQGLHFIAFEFVEGETLRQLMEMNGGTLPVRESVSIMMQVCAGLAHAYERGVVHRDIKPSNIIVTPEGKAKIVDMGLARSLDSRVSGQLTQSGVTLGTFDYISPEQALEPRSADVRSDLYSLGCTLYHVLTGHVPVPEGTAAKKLDAHKNILPPDPREYNPNIPADLTAILGRMMAKNPDQRYQHPDHVSAHLRQVAKNIGMASVPDPPSSLSVYNDTPLPAPPRLSPAWILTGAALLALILIIVINANQQPPDRQHPAWNAVTKSDSKKGSDPLEEDPLPPAPAPVAITGVREAADTNQLIALLKQGAKHIRLRGGNEYDLTRSADGIALEALFTGSELRLEGVQNPTVKLGFAPSSSKARPRTITLHGPGDGAGNVQISGIRFVFASGKEGGLETSGLAIDGYRQVTIEKCTFTTPSFRSSSFRSGAEGPAAIALFGHTSVNLLNKCYFAPGVVAVRWDSPGILNASECAFAPQKAIFRVTRSIELPGTSELTLMNCSALLTAGSLVQIANDVPCSIKAGKSLFSGPPERPLSIIPIPTLVLQEGERADDTKYEAARSEKDRQPYPNIYHNISALTINERNYTFAECAEQEWPFADIERQARNVWEERDPFALLDAKPMEPKRAFRQNLRELYELTGSKEIIGTQFLGPDPLFPIPNFVPESPAPRNQTIKIWDPSKKEEDKLEAGVYRTLNSALADAQPGDTIAIRYTGRLEVLPCEFEKKDTNLTIKPEGTNRPELVPSPSTLKKSTALFKLFGGRLVLDGIQVRLPSNRVPSLAVIPGSGQFEFRNGVITFEEGEDLTAVTLTDPRGEMVVGKMPPERWQPPKISFENVLLRGRGRMLNVPSSRPFELDAKNTLAALDGSLIDISPSNYDSASGGSMSVRLQRVTTYLSGNFLNIRAGEPRADMMGPSGIARTDIAADNCLFLLASESREAFVRADRFDSVEQVERLLSWRGKNNIYGYDKKKVMLEIRPTDLETSPSKMLEGDRWLEITREEGDPFARVEYDYTHPAAGRSSFSIIRPADFRIRSIEPQRTDLPITELGVSPTDLPRPFGGIE